VLRFDPRRLATGRTSVTYHVDVFSRQIESRDEEIVFSTDITFVCVDNNGTKTPIEPQRAGKTGAAR
jgi:acyl-CoA hydrolase